MIKKIIKLIIKYVVLFVMGGLVYCGIELMWRERTHISSFIMGGTAILVVGGLNEGYDWDMPVWYQMLLSSLFITAMEYVVGINFNADYHIWDYRELWLNIDGQICLGYSLLWGLLGLVGILLDDFIRWIFFGEEKPKYKWI